MSTDRDGYYIYAEASDMPNEHAYAQLVSRPISNARSQQTFCLRFHYHMYGSESGALYAIIKKYNGTKVIIWSQYGNMGAEWKSGAQPFATDGPFQVSNISVFIDNNNHLHNNNDSYNNDYNNEYHNKVLDFVSLDNYKTNSQNFQLH